MKRLTVVLSCILALLLHSPAYSQDTTSRPAEEAIAKKDQAPRPYQLAVIIVIDQFRADFLTRFGDLFVPDGLKLFLERGAWFTHCNFEHGVTKTGPGHACIATGANPPVHGIINNDWFADEGEKYQKVSCVEDLETSTLGLTDKPAKVGRSPRRLLADTLAEQLKKAMPARVLSCSLKDTAAVLSSGKAVDEAYWYDDDTGRFVTSSFYGPTMPAWAKAFNDSKYVDQFVGKSWTRITGVEEYDHRCHRDDAEFEWGKSLDWTNAFPHGMSEPGSANPPGKPYYKRLQETPYGNELLLAFTRQGVEALKLGQRQVTDLLIVSLSSNDLVGHRFGPDSHEVMDITLQTDRQLAEFFRFLDQKVGLNQCLIALSSDHGACMIPEYAEDKGISAGRLDVDQLDKKLEQALVRDFGQPQGSKYYVAGIEMPWLHLVPQAVSKIPPDKLRETVDEVLVEEPALETMYWAQDIAAPDFVASARDVVEARVKAAYHPQRSGQVYLHLQKHWYRTGHATGHGTAYDYDTHVPLLLFGRDIKPGRYDAPASPTDIAPTLAKLLNIKPPSQATGRILKEALQNP